MAKRQLLLVLVLLVVVETTSYDVFKNTVTQNDVHQFIPYGANAEYIRHISSIMNAYRSDVMGGRLVIETNSQIDTRYRTWKRNADLINSLLALPKGMNDAGR